MKLNIFKKTVISSFIVSLTTLLAFSFILQGLTGTILNKYANEQLTSAEKEIKQLRSINDLSINRLRSIEDDYRVSISIYSDTGIIIYPNFGSFPIDSDTTLGLPLFNSQESLDDQRTSQKDFTLNIEGYKLLFSINHNSVLNTNELKVIFKSMIPYLLIISLLMSLIVSYFYSKFTLKKINQMNTNMENMKLINYSGEYIEGYDELASLDKDIHELYYKLLSEMERISEIEADRHLFMRGTIHQLKTPIMLMEIQMRDLLENNNSDDITLDIINLQDKLSSIKSLVNSGLDISSIKDFDDLKEINLKESINENIDFYEAMINDKNINLKTALLDYNIKIDKNHLNKVISNLLTNAIKYSDNDSNITIKQDNKSFTITNEFTKPIEDISQITKAFVRDKSGSSEEGHGLGLYISTNILKIYDYVERLHLSRHFSI